MSIRVMMVGPFPRSLTRIDGGVEAATTYLSQALVKIPGIELIGVRITGKRLAGASEPLGWPVTNLELGRFGVSTVFHRQKRLFASLVRQFRPDVIHAQGADLAGYLAVKSGCPAVVTIHGVLTECAKLSTNFVVKVRGLAQALITERYVVERAAHLIAISPYVARHYKGRLRGIIHDIPNAVARPFFELHRKPEPGRFLFAGRVSHGKGVIDLVNAFARVTQGHQKLILAGAIPDREFEKCLRTVTAATGQTGRVVLTGLLDERALLDQFARASALVLPSYQETAPMVIQQAMAARLPVVATHVGGIPDMIENEISGLLFAPGQVEALAHLLHRLAEDASLGQRLAIAAGDVADERFTAEEVASATFAAYQKVLAEN